LPPRKVASEEPISCIERPRRLALAASIFTSSCGVSNLRSESEKMKRPLFWAAVSIFDMVAAMSL
jgi:hypothetical protein